MSGQQNWGETIEAVVLPAVGFLVTLAVQPLVAVVSAGLRRGGGGWRRVVAVPPPRRESIILTLLLAALLR